VYGTLKQGHGRNGALETATFLGRTILSSRLDLVNLGPFPALTPGNRQTDTLGEAYLVDDATLSRLDRIEGHPDFYRRVQQVTEFGPTWVYVLPEITADRITMEGIEREKNVAVWHPTEEEREHVRRT